MTILAYDELVHLIDTGVIKGGKRDAVSGSSIDLHLGNRILIEKKPLNGIIPVLDYRDRTPLLVDEYVMDKEDGYVLNPGEFILAHSVESFDVPMYLSSLLRSKSSMGRMGFEHLDAGFVDAGFDGALTFEFVNVLRYHAIHIRPGDAVGQLIWHRHAEVAYRKSYKAKGRYSGSDTVEQARPAR